MRKVVIIGAGASKSYSESKTGLRMPIANDFFSTFTRLEISGNPWVLIGNIIEYVVKYRKIKKLYAKNRRFVVSIAVRSSIKKLKILCS